jgi:hypothetical protein
MSVHPSPRYYRPKEATGFNLLESLREDEQELQVTENLKRQPIDDHAVTRSFEKKKASRVLELACNISLILLVKTIE